jgi:hypothetical protein
MTESNMLNFVNFDKKTGKSKISKNIKGKCITMSKRFDTWTIYCDSNKNGKLDKNENEVSYKFRANAKKAKKAKMELECQ